MAKKEPAVSKQGKVAQGKADPMPGYTTVNVKKTKTSTGSHRGGNNYNQTVMTKPAENFVINQIPKIRKSKP